MSQRGRYPSPGRHGSADSTNSWLSQETVRDLQNRRQSQNAPGSEGGNTRNTSPFPPSEPMDRYDILIASDVTSNCSGALRRHIVKSESLPNRVDNSYNISCFFAELTLAEPSPKADIPVLLPISIHPSRGTPQSHLQQTNEKV